MEFTVERAPMLEGISWAARPLSARPPVPILAGIVIDASNDQVKLSAFDYEISSESTVKGTVTEPGKVVAPGRLLAEIVRNLPEEPIRFTTENNRLKLTCGKGVFTMAELPSEDYPALPALADPSGELETAAFAKAVRQIAPAASRDDTLPMLTAAHIISEGDKLCMVCTDRFRIAISKFPWAPNDGEPRSALVPMRTVNDAVKSLTGGGSMFASLPRTDHEESQSRVSFDWGDRNMTMATMEGPFVPYEKHLPTSFSLRVEVDIEEFSSALKRVALFADQANTPVKLVFSPGEVTLSGTAGSESEGVESVAAVTDGEEDFTIAFNKQFLLDGLTSLNSSTAIMSFTTQNGKAQIEEKPEEENSDDSKSKTEFLYVVMPTRL